MLLKDISDIQRNYRKIDFQDRLLLKSIVKLSGMQLATKWTYTNQKSECLKYMQIQA